MLFSLYIIYDSISGIERIHRDWSAMDGRYDAVIQDIKEIHPGIMTFQAWAKRKSSVAAKRTKGWNWVSILALVLGKQYISISIPLGST
jgi:hypothetical protein